MKHQITWLPHSFPDFILPGCSCDSQLKGVLILSPSFNFTEYKISKFISVSLSRHFFIQNPTIFLN